MGWDCDRPGPPGSTDWRSRPRALPRWLKSWNSGRKLDSSEPLRGHGRRPPDSQPGRRVPSLSVRGRGRAPWENGGAGWVGGRVRCCCARGGCWCVANHGNFAPNEMREQLREGANKTDRQMGRTACEQGRLAGDRRTIESEWNGFTNLLLYVCASLIGSNLSAMLCITTAVMNVSTFSGHNRNEIIILNRRESTCHDADERERQTKEALEQNIIRST